MLGQRGEQASGAHAALVTCALGPRADDPLLKHRIVVPPSVLPFRALEVGAREAVWVELSDHSRGC